MLYLAILQSKWPKFDNIGVACELEVFFLSLQTFRLRSILFLSKLFFVEGNSQRGNKKTEFSTRIKSRFSFSGDLCLSTQVLFNSLARLVDVSSRLRNKKSQHYNCLKEHWTEATISFDSFNVNIVKHCKSFCLIFVVSFSVSLCAATQNGNIRIWDSESKQVVAELTLGDQEEQQNEQHDGKLPRPTSCNCICCSTDGFTLYAGFSDNWIRIWKLLRNDDLNQ